MAHPQPLEPIDARAFSRLALGIGAHFDTLDGRQQVRLIDLSQAGAQLILNGPEPVDKGVLSWLRFDTYAEVVWQEDDHVGLKFDRLLPMPFLVETRMRAPSVVQEEALHSQLAQAWVAGNLADD